GLDAERVEAWRRGEVGFPSLRINASTIIDLVSDAGGPSSSGGDSDTSRTNLAHFCLVTDSPNLDAAMHSLAAAGVAVETGPVTRSGARGNALSIYFRDPDQNLIELRTYAGQA